MAAPARIDLVAIKRRAHNDVAANPAAAEWIAAVSNADVLALVAAVEAARKLCGRVEIRTWELADPIPFAAEDLRTVLARFSFGEPAP